jgi:dihydroneopterin aldolase
MPDRISLTNLQVEGVGGVHDWERVAPQPWEVDVELALDLAPAGTTDDLATTIDYGPVARIVKTVIEDRGFRLIEAFAEAIAAELLVAYPSVEEVTVRVRKPAVQLAVPVDHAAVELTRRR